MSSCSGNTVGFRRMRRGVADISTVQEPHDKLVRSHELIFRVKTITMHSSATQCVLQAEPKGDYCARRHLTKTVHVQPTTTSEDPGAMRTQSSASVGDTVWAQRWAASWGVMVVIVATLFSVVTMEVTAFIPDFLDWGQCSAVKLQEDFDPIKYQGVWWDIARVPNEYQRASVCLSQNISWTGSSLEVNSSGLTATGEKSGTFASMVMEGSRDPPNPAHMTVTSEGVPTAPYQVMSTDYTQYACVYSCLQFPGVFADFFWIFGRTPTLSKELQQICLDLFEEAGIDTHKMVPVEQGESCPYYPHLAQLRGFNTNLLNEVENGAGGKDTNSIFDTGRSHKLSHSDALVGSPRPSGDSASLPDNGTSKALTSSLLLLLPSLLLLLPFTWLLR